MRGSRLNGTFDAATAREAFAGPGQDTRAHLSLGWVQPDTDGKHSVSFTDDDGTPLPNGVRVLVKLEPSGTLVSCMVGSQVSGEGETEYHPCGPGDIVVVGLMGGSERGCVILCRINLSQDSFPQAVAGMDVTQNNINFKRMLLPYVIETAGSYMVRQGTGASWSIDPTGNIIFVDGEGNSLSINQTALTLQESTGTASIQINNIDFTASLLSGGTSITVDDYGSGQAGFPGVSIITGGGVQIITGTGLPVFTAPGHAVTLEQVVVLVESYFLAFAGLLAPLAAPLTGTSLGAAMLIMGLDPGTGTGTLGAAAIPLATTLPLSTDAPILTVALKAQVPDPTGLIPGIGRPNFLL
jgi:hypothetical protein